MLLIQFLLVNVRFSLCILAALVSFAVFWLYFDAWQASKTLKQSYKFLGFLLLAISFVIQSTIIEQSLLKGSILGTNTLASVQTICRLLAYIVIIIAQIAEPLQPLPDYRKQKPSPKFEIALVGILPLFNFTGVEFLKFLLPILAAVCGFMYLRRATAGLEHHLKPVSLGFYFLAIFELFDLASLLRTSDNVTLSNLTTAFGPIWIVEQILLILSFFVIGRWVWGYLLKRFENQLFMIFTGSIVAIFLVTTIFFTYATLNNLRSDILAGLKTDVSVLGYTVESKKAEILSDAQVVAQNPEIIRAVIDQDRRRLVDLTGTILITKKQTSLIIVTEEGGILVRAEDPEKIGGSLSDDPLIKASLSNKNMVSFVTREGVIAPRMTIEAVAPIVEGKEVMGAVKMVTEVDNAYVDGVKAATNLNASVYVDNIRSATTFISPDGKTRWIGIKEDSQLVKDMVLDKGEIFTGSVNLLNVPYFAAYSPLVDVDNNPLGMLFVGKPEASALQTASRSIEITFVTTAALLVLSIIPSFVISKYIASQI